MAYGLDAGSNTDDISIVGVSCEDVNVGDTVTVNTCGDTVNLVAKTIHHKIHHGVIENTIIGNIIPTDNDIPKGYTFNKKWKHLYLSGIGTQPHKIKPKPDAIIEDIPFKPHEGLFDFYQYDFANTKDTIWGTDYSKLEKKLFISGDKMTGPIGTIEDKPKIKDGYIPVPKLILNIDDCHIERDE